MMTIFLIHTVRPLLDKFEKIHLVTNPQFDKRNRVIYELVVRKNKSIRITTVYDFCEKSLKKVYIPDDVSEINPNLLTIPTFGRRVDIQKRSLTLRYPSFFFSLHSLFGFSATSE